jgi:hypothetical protein
LKSILIYFSGGVSHAIPTELAFDYALRQLRFIFISFILTYYFAADYSVITMAIAIILADLRFHMDFDTYMALVDREEFSPDTDDEE